MILLDTGPIVAAANPRDPDHQACANLLNSRRDELVTTCSVVEETAYMISQLLGHERESIFARAIAEGEVMVHHLESPDWARISELIDKYGDLSLGSVDASLIAVAERLDVKQLVTLDHRHFAIVRPNHCKSLELLP